MVPFTVYSMNCKQIKVEITIVTVGDQGVTGSQNEMDIYKDSMGGFYIVPRSMLPYSLWHCANLQISNTEGLICYKLYLHI